MAVTIAERLVEAEAAYHRLMTSQQAVEIRDSNGESVRFNTSSASRLASYIADLKAQLAGTAGRRGPLSPSFG